MIARERIDLVLDVGANVGQYGEELRDSGYSGEIWSFEPVADAFASLQRAASRDPRWRCFNLAIGDRSGEIGIRIATNSATSSVLPVLTARVKTEPELVQVAVENAAMVTLDSLMQQTSAAERRVWLKVDVQGFEDAVFAGAEELLSRVQGVEAELSLVPIYEGQSLYRELIDHLCGYGLQVASLDPVFFDQDTGHMLQIDAIFVRSRADQVQPSVG
jgi:FkbM family methyltransferase